MSDDFVETFLSELEAIYKNNPNVQDGMGEDREKRPRRSKKEGQSP